MPTLQGKKEKNSYWGREMKCSLYDSKDRDVGLLLGYVSNQVEVGEGDLRFNVCRRIYRKGGDLFV